MGGKWWNIQCPRSSLGLSHTNITSTSHPHHLGQRDLGLRVTHDHHDTKSVGRQVDEAGLVINEEVVGSLAGKDVG